MTTALIFIGLLLLLLAGVDIAFALAGLGVVLLLAADLSPLLIPQAMMSSMDNFILLAVPLFVLMGNFIARAGLADELYAAAYAWIGHRRGGLAMATIVSCGGFSAVCGSSVATAATMAKVAMPQMRRFKYADSLATGAIAAGGTLGIPVSYTHLTLPTILLV